MRRPTLSLALAVPLFVVAAGVVLGISAPAWADIFASVLPGSRSVGVGVTATVFASIANGGPDTAHGCGVALGNPALPVTFGYQTTDPQTNALTGSPNTPVDVPAGEYRSFVLFLTPSAVVDPQAVPFDFTCSDTDPAASVEGLNTLLFSASDPAGPDIIALAATVGNTGIVEASPAGAFAVASINLGAAGTVTVAPGTGQGTLPLDLTICETEPLTGACKDGTAPAPSVTLPIAAGATPTFAVFVGATDDVPLDPALKRVFVNFQVNPLVGSTSVAVEAGVVKLEDLPGNYTGTASLHMQNCNAPLWEGQVLGYTSLVVQSLFTLPSHGWMDGGPVGASHAEVFLNSVAVSPAGAVSGTFQIFLLQFSTQEDVAFTGSFTGDITTGTLSLSWNQRVTYSPDPLPGGQPRQCDFYGAMVMAKAPEP